MFYKLVPWRVLENREHDRPAQPSSHRLSNSQPLVYRSVGSRSNEDLLPMGGLSFTPICTSVVLWYRNTNASFLIMCYFRFQTCLKGSARGPPPPKIPRILQSQTYSSFSFLLFFQMQLISGVRLPLGHLQDRLYIVFMLFSSVPLLVSPWYAALTIIFTILSVGHCQQA